LTGLGPSAFIVISHKPGLRDGISSANVEAGAKARVAKAIRATIEIGPRTGMRTLLTLTVPLFADAKRRYWRNAEIQT
jgi:ribosomal protein L39E